MDKTICVYDGQTMSVSDYLSKRGVSLFESQLRKLARKSALCNADGTAVGGSGLYPPLREGFPTHQGRRCLYFERNVLPQDKNLEADYWAIFQGGKVSQSVMIGICKRCEQDFIKQAKNKVYCDDCVRYRDRERKRKYYHEQKENGL